MLPVKFKLKASIFLSFAFLLIYIVRPVAAQAPGTGQNTNIYGDFAPDVPRNVHTLSQTAVLGVLSATVCALAGVDPLDRQGKCLGMDPKTGQIGYVNQQTGGVSQIMGQMIGSTMSIPVSSGDYIAYATQNFGITKSAYAQTNGFGYDRLSPLINIWAKFRDIAYLLFVLAFTVIGLAIMFRVKIDPRTIMTIQNQIPKIIIALIMVTFSYAIAGFLIDVMYVLIYLVLMTFSTLTPVHVNPQASVFSVVNKAFAPGGIYSYIPGNSGIMALTTKTSIGIAGVFGSLTADFLDSTISGLFKVPFLPLNALEIGCNVLSAITIPGNLLGHIPGLGDFLKGIPGVGRVFGGGASCDFVEGFFQLFITTVFGIIAFLVVLIAILYSLFRIWFTLVKSFVYVLIDTMLGPLWIAAGIFPGSKLGFTPWVRHLAGHLSVFPMTFAAILLGKTIMDGVGGGNTKLFSPPLIGDAIGGSNAVAAFVGFGFILSIPTILERTKKVVGAMDFGLTDVKASFGVSRGLTGKGMSGVTSTSFGSKYELGAQGQTTAVGGPKRFLKGMLGR